MLPLGSTPNRTSTTEAAVAEEAGAACVRVPALEERICLPVPVLHAAVAVAAALLVVACLALFCRYLQPRKSGLRQRRRRAERVRFIGAPPPRIISSGMPFWEHESACGECTLSTFI
eukprot:COSAG01_NODE_2293_length_7967_cov_83.137646_2_plen_117_part_00